MNQVATIQQKSKWSIEVIQKIASPEEYAIYKNAGLKEVVVQGKKQLIRGIDLDYTETGFRPVYSCSNRSAIS